MSESAAMRAILPRNCGRKNYEAFRAAADAFERIEAGQTINAVNVACFEKPDKDFLQMVRENLDKLGLERVDVMYAVLFPSEARSQELPKYRKYIPEG